MNKIETKIVLEWIFFKNVSLQKLRSDLFGLHYQCRSLPGNERSVTSFFTSSIEESKVDACKQNCKKVSEVFVKRF